MNETVALGPLQVIYLNGVPIQSEEEVGHENVEVLTLPIIHLEHAQNGHQTGLDLRVCDAMMHLLEVLQSKLGEHLELSLI